MKLESFQRSEKYFYRNWGDPICNIEVRILIILYGIIHKTRDGVGSFKKKIMICHNRGEGGEGQ